MSRRPAEMASMVRHFDYAIDGDVVLASQSDAAIRSLRVKLFRERARWHKMEAEANEQACCYSAMGRHYRAFARFTLIAADVERGDR